MPTTGPDPPNFLGQYFRVEGSDFQEQIVTLDVFHNIVINSRQRRVCSDMRVYDDQRVEQDEYLGLTLEVFPSVVLVELDPMYNRTTIIIQDDDSELIRHLINCHMHSYLVCGLKLTTLVFLVTLQCMYSTTDLVKVFFNFAGAVVGFYKTLYSVGEDVELVEVCVVVHTPTISCPIQFPFNVSLNVFTGNAGILFPQH